MPRGDQRGTRLIITAMACAGAVMVVGVVVRGARPVLDGELGVQPTHHRVDVNGAGAAALAALPGLGPGLAQGIIAHREAHGPFASPDDLTNVKRIGSRTVERLRPWIVCGTQPIRSGRP